MLYLLQNQPLDQNQRLNRFAHLIVMVLHQVFLRLLLYNKGRNYTKVNIHYFRRQIERSLNRGWRIEHNLLGNDRYQNGLLTFGPYALRVDIARTTSNLLDPARSSMIASSAVYRSVYQLQGYLNMGEFAGGTYFSDRAFAFNYSNGRPDLARYRPRYYCRIWKSSCNPVRICLLRWWVL